MYYCCLCGYHGFDVEKPVQRAETMTNDNALLIENLYCYKIKQAGASFKMFPPLLCLVFLFGLLLCFPLSIFPLPVLALKELLYLREQDTGKGLYLVIGNPRAVVIGLLSARHGITPLKLPLVEQVALKHRTVSGNETASRILWNLFGGAGVIENDLRKYAVRPAANTEIHVVAYLAGDDRCIRSLRGKNKVDTKRPPLPRDGGQPAFNLRQ